MLSPGRPVVPGMSSTDPSTVARPGWLGLVGVGAGSRHAYLTGGLSSRGTDGGGSRGRLPGEAPGEWAKSLFQEDRYVRIRTWFYELSSPAAPVVPAPRHP